jgi:hypothetical protein
VGYVAPSAAEQQAQQARELEIVEALNKAMAGAQQPHVQRYWSTWPNGGRPAVISPEVEA